MSDRFTRLTFFLRLAAGIHLLSYGSMHTRHTQKHTPEAQTLFSFRVRDGHSSTRATARVASPPPVSPCVFDRQIVRVARETEHRAKLSLAVRSRD